MMKYWNFNYNGTIPYITGDRRYSQDVIRDHRSLQDRIGQIISDIMDSVPILLNGGVVTQGSGANLNITAGFGYAKHEVDIPNDWSTSPPGKLQEDIILKVLWAAQTNINASSSNCSIYSVVDDGSTVNYAKMRFKETNGNTRTRAKATGTYAYEVLPDFDLQVNSTAPTDYDIEIARFTSSSGVYTFISTGVIGSLSIDNIVEKTINNGITIDGLSIKDGKIVFPNWISAYQVGSDLNITGIGTNMALAALNGTDVAFIDSTNADLRTYRFNGNIFTQVGNDLNISGVGSVALAALNGTDVAFADSTNDELRTYRFDGTDWSQVGNSLSISGVGFNIALAALNGTDIAFIDSSNEDLRTYRFNGTNWSQVGNDLNISGIGIVALAALNGTDVVFIDDTQEDLRTYRFDGTDWSQVGNDLNISGVGFLALAALNETDVAFIDTTQEDLRIYRFDGTDWVQVGNDLNISSIGNLALTTLNGTDVTFIDNTNNDLRIYRFAYFLSELPHSPINPNWT